MIEINKLSKSFGNHEVLHSISLQFEKGMVYGIVGDNGAGKTTLFRCIAGLEEYSGTIDSEWQPIKNHLGWLPTEPFFFSKITGKEYIQLLCNARRVNPGKIDEHNIFDLPLNQYASTYSTGMKKKLAITGLLLQKNEVLILDEPFNGVDIHSNILLTEIILKLKSLGKTILLSSHIFSTLSDTCDQIFLLSQGVITRQADKTDFSLLEKDLKKKSLEIRLDFMEQ